MGVAWLEQQLGMEMVASAWGGSWAAPQHVWAPWSCWPVWPVPPAPCSPAPLGLQLSPSRCFSGMGWGDE